MITDEMIHGSWTELRQPVRRKCCRRRHRVAVAAQPARIAPGPAPGASHPAGIRIEWDTPILPHVIAQGVCEEVAVWLDSPLPTEWVEELTERTNVIYARNEHFRRRIRTGGNAGRDYLWAFMRHWLASLLYHRRHDLFARLPADYSIGCDLFAASGSARRR